MSALWLAELPQSQLQAHEHSQSSQAASHWHVSHMHAPAATLPAKTLWYATFRTLKATITRSPFLLLHTPFVTFDRDLETSWWAIVAYLPMISSVSSLPGRLVVCRPGDIAPRPKTFPCTASPTTHSRPRIQRPSGTAATP
jgi:hypothetical protein